MYYRKQNLILKTEISV